jgi:hypothetical protein
VAHRTDQTSRADHLLERPYDVFLIGVPFIVVAFVVSWFLKEVPLRTGPGPGGPPPDGQLPAETVAAP